MTKKTIKHASADVGLIFSAYNLRRIFNLIDPNLLKQYLKVLPLYFGPSTALFKAFYGLFYFENDPVTFSRKKINCILNHIYLPSN
jgi:hypothetical protein